jgi:hypothetical protein
MRFASTYRWDFYERTQIPFTESATRNRYTRPVWFLDGSTRITENSRVDPERESLIAFARICADP